MLYNRYIFFKIWEQIDSSDILIINGARQVGKTSILKLIASRLEQERHVPPEHIHWFDLEKTTDLGIWSQQETALAALPLQDQERHYVFIDEFQQSSTIGSTLKVLHDHYPQFKIITTGSASWYLSLDESLAGRKRLFVLWPLSFAEYIDWQGDSDIQRLYYAASHALSITEEAMRVLNQNYMTYLNYGGYPAVVLATTEEEKRIRLAELVDSYIMRDVQISRYAANGLQIRKLLSLLSGYTGSLLDLPALATDVGLGRTALLNRLDLLERTFVLHLVKPYFTNKRKELVKNPKVYLSDIGMRNYLLHISALAPQTVDFGHVAENAVYMDALRTLAVNEQLLYWRTKTGQEVDFVKRYGATLIPIEVKGGSVKTIPDNLKRFIRAYTPTEAQVRNWSVMRDETFEGCTVRFRPLWYPW